MKIDSMVNQKLAMKKSDMRRIGLFTILINEFLFIYLSTENSIILCL